MKEKIAQIINDFVKKYKENINFTVEYPKEEKFGDYSTNMAMIMASKLKKNPKAIAEEFVEFAKQQKPDLFEKIEIAGPGFVNFYINKNAFAEEIKRISENVNLYLKPKIDSTKKVQVEFVSANPTGPLHVGHGRGAAIGDSIARILSFCGYEVEKEYYINDAGLQMHLLGLSTFIRYKQLLGIEETLPEDGYKGEYLIEVAKKLIVEYGETLLNKKESEAVEICMQKAAKDILKDIMETLKDFRVEFDKVFNEKKLYDSNEVEQSLSLLKEKNAIYEKDGALWFKSTGFGDDKDRVLKRSNGVFTYFASDVAYHRNKFLKRGFSEVIDVWGSDHHGYVKRVKAAIQAMGIDPNRLKVVLVQIVNLLRNGQKVSMSTRRAEFVELKDVVKEVGVDAARFMFVSRSVDSHLDFDLELAKKQSSENPVYYVQYAHARINSILEQLNSEIDLNADPSCLKEKEEIELIKSVIKFKELLEKAFLETEPYFIVKGLLEVAEKLHRFYNKHRVIIDNEELKKARVLLVWVVKEILKIGLSLIGVEAKNKM
ncbi:arginine--tRNA ligase [Hippea maritima]|uniref:Arginine--tRNA ligase n=1 Tax=Hippea maritima (strain ATCC 700847 / DSM 10411 / MH2) TaxID=760142 RepID=F2LW01_HIPMA|nr:arginine--tRNA ligase [Hippea maritima]AEA33935.1 Arginyl-tRNA synthetase [Hippea maritima DSM 10411]